MQSAICFVPDSVKEPLSALVKAYCTHYLGHSQQIEKLFPNGMNREQLRQGLIDLSTLAYTEGTQEEIIKVARAVLSAFEKAGIFIDESFNLITP
jgi:hypothetical protein